MPPAPTPPGHLSFSDEPEWQACQRGIAEVEEWHDRIQPQLLAAQIGLAAIGFLIALPPIVAGLRAIGWWPA